MILKVYEENPSHRNLKTAADILRKGGVVIYPTDTVYAMGCSLQHIKTVDRIAQIKGIKKDKTEFSLIINSLSMLSEFCKPIDNHLFRLMKKNLPGPFTFILNANNKVPKLFQSKKKTIGLRVPDNNITIALVEELGQPLLTTSIYDKKEPQEYNTDPEIIFENYASQIDALIDGGFGGNIPSTVIDCTSGDIEIIRQGKGNLIE